MAEAGLSDSAMEENVSAEMSESDTPPRNPAAIVFLEDSDTERYVNAHERSAIALERIADFLETVKLPSWLRSLERRNT